MRKVKLARTESECVSDCCLIPTQQFFSYIMARTSEIMMMSALY